MMPATPPVVQITATDLDSGAKQSTEIPAGDYFLTTTPPCEVERVEAYDDGYVIVILKGRTVTP